MNWEELELGQFFADGGSVDPSKYPKERFELFSIPSFDMGKPELLSGMQIGSSKKLVQPDDVMISKIVPHIKRSWVVSPSIGYRQIASSEWIVFRSKRFWPKFLRCFLVSDKFHAAFMRTVSGVGGSLLRARPAQVSKIKVPLPPLAEQKRIAGILDAADALRAKRREALAQLDTLLQSTFLDMFGDPVTNPKGWDVRQLKESGVEVKVGPFGSLLHKADYIPDGIPLINPKHIVDGSIEHSGDESVSTSKANELQEYLLKEGDVLLARRGEMGRCVIIRAAHENWLCGTGSVIVRVTSNLYDPEFLAAAFGSQQMRKHLENLSGGAIMPSLSGTQIKTLPLLVPPRSKQNEFSLFIKLLKAQKSRMQAHLVELDALFASLQSRAFNGEL